MEGIFVLNALYLPASSPKNTFQFRGLIVLVSDIYEHIITYPVVKGYCTSGVAKGAGILFSLSFFSPTYQMDFVSSLPFVFASLTVISGNDPNKETCDAKC